MHTVTKLSLAICLALVLGASLAFAQTEWINIDTGEEGTTPQVVIDERDRTIDVHMHVSGFFAKTITKEKGFVQLSIPQCGANGSIGDPEMPYRHVLLTVPHGLDVRFSVQATKAIPVMQDVRVFPVQHPQPETYGPEPAFAFNKQSYQANQAFPSELVRLVSDASVRGHRVIGFEISPLQYNPSLGSIVAYSDLQITIQLEGVVDKYKETMKERRSNAFYNSMLSAFVENFTPRPIRKDVPDGIEYLIIAYDGFIDEVAPLAEWKTMKGLTTEVVAMGTIGTTSTALQNFLQTRYDADDDLTYVLLVGDEDQVPTHDVGYNVSDLEYSCLDGTDIYPDVTLGRISVETEAQCTTVINKIVNYERTPVAGDWYDKALVAALLQDYNDYNCRADRWFFETATTIMHYLDDETPMTTYNAYVTDNYNCTSYQYRSDDYPHRFSHPSTIPSADTDLLVSGSAGTQAVIDAINGGVSIVQHRDHGGETGWGDPDFDTGDIANLTNGDKLPVVFSLNCLTGTFDHYSPCFAEAFIRKENGGALGVMAASASSYSGYNDLIAHGMFDCFWDDYDTDSGSNVYSHSWRPCEAMNYGKYYMDYWYSSGSLIDTEWEIFHWFGDPEMMMRNGTQITPTINHLGAVIIGSPSLTVNCSAEGALVAVTDNGTLIGRAVVNGGVATVMFDPVPTTVTTLDVVVTGHNLDTYEGTCLVYTDGPFLVYDSHTINETTGNGDGIINPGETINMPVTVQNIGNSNAYSISATLSTASTYCDVTDNYATFPNIAVDGYGQSNANHYSFTVDPSTPDGTQINFALDWTVSDAKDIHTGTTYWSVSVSAPVLAYNNNAIDDSVGGNNNGRLDPGEQAAILVYLKNNGSTSATGISAVLTDDSDYVTITDDQASWDDIGPGATGVTQAPHFAVSIDAAAPMGADVTFSLAITCDGGYAFTQNFEGHIGILGTVLVVDDSSGGSADTIAAVLTDCDYLVVQEDESATDPATWTDYDILVYSCGVNTNSITSHTGALVSYVAGGGHVFLEGGEVLYDHDDDGAFATTVMYCDDWDHDSSGNLTLADPTHPIAATPNTLPSTISHSYSSYGDEDSGAPLAGAIAVFTWSSYSNLGSVFAHDNDSDPSNGGQIVFCSFNMEKTTTSGSARSHLIENIAAWLAGNSQCNPPTVTTGNATDMTTTGALLHGTGNPMGCQASVYFEYGQTTAYGSTTSEQDLGAGSSDVPFEHAVSGLSPTTTYHFRAVITSAGGTEYGGDNTFTTAAPEQLNAPVLLTPADGTDNLDTTVTVTWQDTNSDAEENYYRLRVRPAGGAYTYYDLAAGTTGYALAGLALGTTYTWNVRAEGDGTNTLDSDWANGGTDWNFSTMADKTGVHRFFNTHTGGHLYTISQTEADYIINNLDYYEYEGIKFQVYPSERSQTTATHRFFNTRTGIHLYTISQVEVDYILNNLPHYSYEGVKFYVYPSEETGTVAMHRFFNTRTGGHLYTISQVEVDYILNNMPHFTYEGIKFYVMP